MLTCRSTIVAARMAQHDRPREVDPDDDPAPVEPVSDGAGGDAEEQLRQVWLEHGQRDEERVAGLGGDEQRAGGEGDAVADVGDDRRREEPAEAAARAAPGRSSRRRA